MWETSEVWYLIAATQLTLLSAVLVRDHRRDPSARASLFLIATVIAHFLAPVLDAHDGPRFVLHPLVILSGVVPFAFWLLAEAHFDDDFRLRPVHGVLLLCLAVVRYAARFFVGEHGIPAVIPTGHALLWAVIPRLFALGFVGHALYRVHAGARADLVVPRLKARYAVLGFSGVYIFLELIAEAFLAGSVSDRTAARIHSATSLALIVGVTLLSLRLDPNVLRPEPSPAEPPAPDPALVARLQHLIDVEQVFREEGLTIALLAERMALHEYKVRQLINAHLGFRNFNAFLHHYRLREAQKALSDPAKSRLGVAQIAYEVGYRSLGPFNKAFKEITGRTPTEFRASSQRSNPS